MASICVHRASRTPSDIAPRHIDSHDGLQEEPRPATELPHKVLRARLVPGPTLSCNSSDIAIAILRVSKAHRLARWHRFVSIALRKPLQTSPQGTSARAMVCRKIADLTQNCHTQPSEPGWSPVSRFPAIHLSRQSPFYGPPRHIGSHDGIDLCPSSAANPSRHRSRAYRLARCFAGSSPNCHTQPSDLDCSLVPRFPAIHLAWQSPF